MKCDKCFFCVHIGSGIYAPYPVKHCRHDDTMKMPFVETCNGNMRKLDFSKISDCKIWHEVGCDIHPSTVAKAKRDYMKKLESEDDRQ